MHPRQHRRQVRPVLEGLENDNDEIEDILFSTRVRRQLPGAAHIRATNQAMTFSEPTDPSTDDGSHH